MKEVVTIVIAKPKQRLRFAPATKVRPGKGKNHTKGNGKWKPKDID